MSQKPKDHPLANILINVILPVLVLSYLSKDPEIQQKLGKEVRPWHIGPLYAMIIALSLPIGYGVWSFLKTRKFNLFSAIGLASVLLTGGLTLYLWNRDGSVKEHAGLLFGLKEGSIPLMLGFAVIASAKSATPLLNVFLYNDSIFDIPKIEKTVSEKQQNETYRGLLSHATRLFALSFFVSSLMNVGLALWFFRGFNHVAPDALEVYNAIIGRLTFWGFVVIGAPILAFLFFTLKYLLKGLRGLTGLTDDELMLPR
ncbi:MAG TPA: VC0807 family protein [Luteolibacter sp.]|nr:VC0807 family protein [Luteolibacter sp.]